MMNRPDIHLSVLCVLAVLAIAGGCFSQPGPDVPAGEDSTLATGTLRVLITDKPYPVEWLRRAEVTITRIEVRRAETDEPGDGCAADADCDDGLFCNGPESCNSSGLCAAGTSPCAAGEACFEDAATCGLCAAAADCDDGLFCNGVESCGTSGLCSTGNDPCASDEACDEDADTCGLPSDDDVDTTGNPFVVIFEGERVFDLLQLQNGQTDLLADVEIPADTYTQMRLLVTAGEVELVDDRVFPLSVPSGEQTGIKLQFTFEVAADEETTLLLDVDLSRAFMPIPGGKIDSVEGIREFKFSPSLAMRLIDLVDAATITGSVVDIDTNGLPNVLVTAFRDGGEVSGTSTAADGTYTLIGLPAGVYDLEFSKTGFTDAVVAGVAVTAGETVTVDPVVLEAE